MRNIFNYLLAVACLFMVNAVDAQVKTPAASPHATFKTTVGLTDITLDYSRPSKKGRVIFGDLVPYDKMWRTGANMNTMITFSDNVSVEGVELKGGTYALFTRPGKDAWEVILYTDTNNGGVPEIDKEKVAAQFKIKPYKINTVETFTIGVNNVSNEGATIDIMWDQTGASMKVNTLTDTKVSASINKTMAGPSAADYYNASRYFYEADKDQKMALVWMDKSLEMGNEYFYTLRQKSLIQAKLGDYKGAIETAQKSMELSKKAGSDAYIKMNEDSIKEWSSKTK